MVRLSRVSYALPWLLLASCQGEPVAPESGSAPAPSFGKAPAPPADPAIAFVVPGNGKPDQLRVINADGSNLTVVFEATTLKEPSWSPDGMSVAFGGTVNGAPGLFTLEIAVVNGRPQGRNFRALTTVGASTPSWSPDGQCVAYTLTNGTDRSIFVIPATGGIPAVLYAPAAGDHSTWPTWHPDLAWDPAAPCDPSRAQRGKLAISERQAATGLWALKLKDLAAGSPEPVREIVPFSDYLPRFPDWSRNGGLIAYSAVHRSDGSLPEVVYTVTPVENGTRTAIAEGGAPTWSPDDKKVAYISLNTMVAKDLISGQVQKLTASGWTHPDWSRQ